MIEGSRTPARRKGGDTTAALWESLRRVDASDLSPKPAGDQFFREPIQEQLDAEAKGRGWYFAAGLLRAVSLLGPDSLVIFASQQWRRSMAKRCGGACGIVDEQALTLKFRLLSIQLKS